MGVHEICILLHFIFVYTLHSVPTLLDLGLYVILTFACVMVFVDIILQDIVHVRRILRPSAYTHYS